jgi:hypothetical protein
MLRAAMRGSMIILALVLAVASPGTVLCEMNCAAGEHVASAAGMTDGAANVASSHCDGERIDLARHDMSARHGSSGGNTKRSGNTKHSSAHSHLRIVATVGAEVQISPALLLSDFAVVAVSFAAANFARIEETFWNNNSSPPIRPPSDFSTGVLRI